MPDIFLSFKSFLNPFVEILLLGLAYCCVLTPQAEANVTSSVMPAAQGLGRSLVRNSYAEFANSLVH